MKDPMIVWEWDADDFHRKVLDLESRGYVSRRESYLVRAEVHPDTGVVVHLHTIEMLPGNEPETPRETITLLDETYSGNGIESVRTSTELL
jgi:hypothetical protein